MSSDDRAVADPRSSLVEAARRAEEDADRRQRILSAVAFAASHFVRSADWREPLGEVLAELGGATGASRVYIFQNHLGDDGDLCFSQRHEWAAPGVSAEIDNPELRGLSYRRDGFAEWVEPLGAGREISRLVRDLESPVRELLEAEAILALVVVPIFGGGKWWGFIGFDECRQERVWPPAETAALRVAAEILGAAIYRQEVEQALRTSEERYRELFENAYDLVFTLDGAGRFTSINYATERALGYPRDEALRLRLTDLVVPEYLEEARRQLADRLAGRPASATYELEVFAKSGRRVNLEVSTRPLLEGGRPAGVQGIGRDISERRRLEAQLRQSQKMEAVGRLAGGVAHDFNNLLTAISGYSDLILRRLSADDPLRHEVEEIHSAGGRAANLTRQLLAFSRRQVMVPRFLDLNATVAGIERMLRRMIGEDIVFVTRLGTDLGRVRADPSQIEQVLMNLVVNARDAMPTGGQLTLETANATADEVRRRTEAEGAQIPCVRLTVRDTGHGMDARTLAQVFEPFFTTKVLGKGTGLGLSTVYGIVKQCGGFVFAASELGRGTTFDVFLPRVEAPADESHPRPAVVPTARGHETVLLVEDEEMVRQLARRILVERGYHVLEAADAAIALELVEAGAGPIGLLLTDVVMPGTSGADLALRLLARFPGLKVLYMSGYTDSLVLRHGVSQVETAFLQKPFAPESLARKVRELLGPLAAPSPAGD